MFSKIKTKSIIHKDAIIEEFGDFSEISCVKFVTYNGFEYREGFVVIFENSAYEIIKILNVHDVPWLLCEKKEVLKYDTFFNSIIISKKKMCSKNIQDC